MFAAAALMRRCFCRCAGAFVRHHTTPPTNNQQKHHNNNNNEQQLWTLHSPQQLDAVLERHRGQLAVLMCKSKACRPCKGAR
jgi:hypothetical protein